MAAISTTLFAFLDRATRFCIAGLSMAARRRCSANRWAHSALRLRLTDGIDRAEMRAAAKPRGRKGRVGLILVETPANPTNGLGRSCGLRRDRRRTREDAKESSAGGGGQHDARPDVSDAAEMQARNLAMFADQVCRRPQRSRRRQHQRRRDLVKQVISWRSAIGTQLDPNSCWMLMRSLETLEIRMTARTKRSPCRGNILQVTRRSPRFIT